MPRNVRKAVQAHLERLRLANEPARLAKPLRANLEGCHRIKVLGNVRIVFQIDEPQRTIEVLRIDYRGNVYD
jgi:mRNA-degrading endonuclease RelE of RelBE toxin-antitoxin system